MQNTNDKTKAITKATPSTNRDIFTRDLNGELVDMNDPEFGKIKEIILRTIELTHKLNSAHHSPESTRAIFSEIGL
ncbi:hypothetical protein [Helicobacter labetoulli]|uniref:hypothetical protein n=1 Tax=Helicobacter labetoulli TaxID=2315333 RepID=UPI001FC945B6|nr:hypothetical protein [Helicobacter labetoulli]